MSEEKLKKLMELLRAAEQAEGGERRKAVAELGEFILDEAMWGGFVLRNNDGGYPVRLEV